MSLYLAEYVFSLSSSCFFAHYSLWILRYKSALAKFIGVGQWLLLVLNDVRFCVSAYNNLTEVNH